MNWNLNSNYGAHLADAIMVAGKSGKIFVVGATGVAYRDQISQLFQPDVDGKVRFAATIASAVALCTANANDQILVLPGHTESVTTATAFDVNVAGVSIVGLGYGSNRPTLTLSGVVGATLTFSASSTSLRNFVIDGTGLDNISSVFTVGSAATDVTIDGCRIVLATASAQAALGLTSAGNGHRLAITNNEFIGTVDAGTGAAILLAGGDDVRIIGNIFIGAYTSGTGAISGAGTTLRIVIKDNLINNLTAGCTKAITLAAGATGHISGNRMQILSGTAPITGAAMSWVGANYYAATIATAGTLI